MIWFWFRMVIGLGLGVVGFGYGLWFWVWVMNLLKTERIKDGLNINSGEVFASKGLIKEVVILHQLVLFHHIFAFRFIFPLWLDVSVLNSPWFWFFVGLWLIMVNGGMIGFWFVVMNWLWLMIGVNWLWHMIGMSWLWHMIGVSWLWHMIGGNRRSVRLWFVIRVSTKMSSVNWITFLLNLWVIETFFVLVDGWNWVWVPELWVSKMITDWFLISIGWCGMMDIRKRGVVWLMCWVCLWLVVWVSVDRLWSVVADGLWNMVSWLWSVISWLWNVVSWLRNVISWCGSMVGFWCMVCWLWSVCDFQSVWILWLITICTTMTSKLSFKGSKVRVWFRLKLSTLNSNQHCSCEELASHSKNNNNIEASFCLIKKMHEHIPSF